MPVTLAAEDFALVLDLAEPLKRDAGRRFWLRSQPNWRPPQRSDQAPCTGWRRKFSERTSTRQLIRGSARASGGPKASRDFL